ncbi:MAG: DUF58 domain-containing protein [Acidimicrobiales bacterium]
MVTSRGQVVAVVAAVLAIAGAIYGIEEFLLVSACVAALFVTGALWLVARAATARSGLVVGIKLASPEATVGIQYAALLSVRNDGRWTTSPVRVEDPRRGWFLTHPGLGANRARWRAEDAEPAAPGDGPVPVPDPRAARTGSNSLPGRLLGFLRTEANALGAIRLPGLRSGTEVAVRIAVPTGSRGLLTLLPLGLWCEDPFRLLGWKVVSSPVVHVLVCPEPERTATGARTSPGGDGVRPPDANEYAHAGGMQGGYEFRSLRDYVPGDRMTRLHWPAFARSGELAVRDFAEPVSGSVSLLVDLRPSSHSGGSIEAVISRTAGLGLRALEDGKLVELCTSAGDRVEIAPGAGSRTRLLRALAVLGPASAPMSASIRWGGTPNGAVWAPENTGVADVYLVTTSAGATSRLPGTLDGRAHKVVVR